MKKTLIIIQHPHGNYSGYIKNDEDSEHKLVFTIKNADELFTNVKAWADRGYDTVQFLEERQAEFLKSSQTASDFIKALESKKTPLEFKRELTIWRYEESSPFAFGKSRKAIATNIDLKNYEIRILHKDFMAVVIRQGKAKGVYELQSGSLVGDTLEEVNADIDACEDVRVMLEQIATATKVRDRQAILVSNEDFGIAE